MVRIQQNFEQAATYIRDVISADGSLMIALAAMIVGAVFVGRELAHRIHRERPKRMRHFMRNYAARMILSLMVSLVLALSAYYAHNNAAHPAAFYFLFKLSLAWLLGKFVYSISSRQQAGWIVYAIILPLVCAHLLGITDDISALLSAVSIEVGSQKITPLKIIKGLASIAVLFWLASRIVGIIQGRMQRASGMHISHRTLVVKTAQIVLYFLVFIIALQIVGVDLTALSVFGGALGVGLGFGLQKIASNFISGIILLMERSIKVGDMVELQDGTVGFIRRTGARYTLMETTDSREILIPNEEFITQRAISWTHSNQIGRIVINLGVAYDSNLPLVQEIMLNAAKEHPRTVADPAPICVMEQFGESSIIFGLYFFIDQVNDGRLVPKSEVMFAIWRGFEAHGIHIPYPQRVVHHLHDGHVITGAADV